MKIHIVTKKRWFYRNIEYKVSGIDAYNRPVSEDLTMSVPLWRYALIKVSIWIKRAEA